MHRQPSKRERRKSYVPPPRPPIRRPKHPAAPTNYDTMMAMIALNEALEKELGDSLLDFCGAFTSMCSLDILLRQGIGRDPGLSENPIFAFTAGRYGVGLDLILTSVEPLEELDGVRTKLRWLDPQEPAEHPRGLFSVSGDKEGLRDVDLEIVEFDLEDGESYIREINMKVGYSPHDQNSCLGVMLRDPEEARKDIYRLLVDVRDNLGNKTNVQLPVYTGAVVFLALMTQAHVDRNRGAPSSADVEMEMMGLYGLVLLLWARAKHRDIVPGFSSQDLKDLFGRCATLYIDGWRTWVRDLTALNRKGRFARDFVAWWEKKNRPLSDRDAIKAEGIFTWTLAEAVRLLDLYRPPPPPKSKRDRRKSDANATKPPMTLRPRPGVRRESFSADSRPPPSNPRLYSRPPFAVPPEHYFESTYAARPMSSQNYHDSSPPPPSHPTGEFTIPLRPPRPPSGFYGGGGPPFPPPPMHPDIYYPTGPPLPTQPIYDTRVPPVSSRNYTSTGAPRTRRPSVTVVNGVPYIHP
ncbi:hypothetical protein JCM8547_003149 [Rhodosporidiobolus lusitaniae]